MNARMPALAQCFDHAGFTEVKTVLSSGNVVFNAAGAYVPGPRGPAFMRLIEKTFGQNVTTRTWETVGKILRA
jgi:uncharacterized protein (DUF1697 family)